MLKFLNCNMPLKLTPQKEEHNYENALKRNFPITQNSIITFPWYIYAPTWINFPQIYFVFTQSHIKISIFTEETSEAVFSFRVAEKNIKKLFCGLNLLFRWFEVGKSFQLPQKKMKFYVVGRGKKCNGREKLSKSLREEIYHVSVIWIPCKILKMEIEMRELTSFFCLHSSLNNIKKLLETAKEIRAGGEVIILK